ncbi:MAG: threonine synthase [Alphaproteobacteria bacterium]|nr:threonine synthase [Alphaproteobacteria bacterium]
MRYVSTRGQAPVLGFEDVLLTGLARDGGLYLPEAWPTLSAVEIRGLAGRPYAEAAARVLAPYAGGAMSRDELETLLADAYRSFGHAAVAPLKQIGPRHWLLELFHGPTLAFKDYALQAVGRLFDRALARRNQRVTIVGATSGDTGSAAIEALRDRTSVDVFVLFPRGRVSEVQRRQMTTVDAPNVHCIALDGTFDDCQDMVKAMFNDTGFRDEHKLSAVNSINWVRIAVQIAYYAVASVALGAPDKRIAFAVPTGNFGNVFAAYGAKRMGFPIERLILGSNSNDILTRFLASGEMKMEPVVPTYSPSMDIQVSSNFERLLFEVVGRDGARVTELLTRFRKDGRFRLDDEAMGRIRGLFEAHRLDDTGTLEVIRRVHRESGELVDPHTAIGIAAAARSRFDPAVPVISLATAHPAKFGEAIERAVGVRPKPPDRLQGMMTAKERVQDLPNDQKTVKSFIAGRVRR